MDTPSRRLLPPGPLVSTQVAVKVVQLGAPASPQSYHPPPPTPPEARPAAAPRPREPRGSSIPGPPCTPGRRREVETPLDGPLRLQTWLEPYEEPGVVPDVVESDVGQPRVGSFRLLHDPSHGPASSSVTMKPPKRCSPPTSLATEHPRPLGVEVWASFRSASKRMSTKDDEELPSAHGSAQLHRPHRPVLNLHTHYSGLNHGGYAVSTYPPTTSYRVATLKINTISVTPISTRSSRM